MKTSVPTTGTKTFNVTLKKGTYKFVCDPHASQMKGRSRSPSAPVGRASGGPAPAGPPARYGSEIEIGSIEPSRIRQAASSSRRTE